MCFMRYPTTEKPINMIDVSSAIELRIALMDRLAKIQTVYQNDRVAAREAYAAFLHLLSELGITLDSLK